MKRLFLLGLALLGAMAPTGCLFSKKGAKPKESSAIAAETEAGFKQRWIEKRGAELAAQGFAPDAARLQATEEFRRHYGYMGAAQK